MTSFKELSSASLYLKQKKPGERYYYQSTLMNTDKRGKKVSFQKIKKVFTGHRCFERLKMKKIKNKLV